MGQEVINDCRHLNANKDPRQSSKSLNLLVPSQIFDKPSLFLYISPHLFWRRTFGQGAGLPKTQAWSRIPLMILMSKQELLAWVDGENAG